MSSLAVLVPTRSRPQNVRRVVEAWEATRGFDAAELFFVVDADDMRFQEYCSEIDQAPGANMVVLPEWRPLVPKLNRTAVEFTDRLAVAFMGDDHLPRTPGWAATLIQSHVQPWRQEHARKPRIVYGQDGLQDERLPTWWSMDSRIIKALGKMVPGEGIQHLFCDNAVMELGKRSGTLYFNGSVLIEHMHPFAGKAEPDAQYERVNRGEQYERDGTAFRAWLADGAERDASLVRCVGG